MDKPKIVHTELKENLSLRFNIIKSKLGIQNDAEVIRFLIQQYYHENLEGKLITEREELEKDMGIIKDFMKKFGSAWRKLGED
jgi:hypothetical protein